ncbi:ammonia-forming cytochrome c nitrite reductase subunit c552 [Roseisolibacter sp. H3M3-2]|uniref:ammonia-forming cytochrome c nitrite reductase subunit c552 n=1 Tax=Roseisolibacter sp. H3M3-2 TaxID=3031323 RepID=UPI0023DA3E96|nr:ammonia-forming cytochrome c nitrite reductase subunit c552 [Roseisolibacter sp. H3M3-2]MDF1504216.1 ammonia-forming cytochrome c nitrite reductase subunit c552 [Roseisolibacter sp. H3M3-2]
MTTPPAGPTPPAAAPERHHRRVRGRWFALAAVVAFAGALGIGALLANIVRRQDEARNPFYRVVALADTTTDPAVWGRNFPQHYDAYRRTTDQVRTRYGGSEAVPHAPTQGDPRTVVAQSRLEEDPRLVEFWRGYAFSTDFREERGHAYVLIDQEFTRRQQATQQPGTCLNCHASMYATYTRLGRGDLRAGFDSVNKLPYQAARKEVTHPVACVDCHDAGTMQLRVTRPAFMEGIRLAKARQGVQDYQVNRDATRQEMRTYVCGQCHVEYYFRGPQKTLTYPWAKGLTADSIMAYYDSTGHRDWAHATSGAPTLKAQHPEFELYNQGVHARSGVACADCHMPYVRTGAMKISDHWVRSPVLNVNRACQTCHKQSEEELRGRVETIQGRTFELRNLALDATLALSRDIRAALAADSASPRVAKARQHHRRAQFYTDFVEAENSMGFHAPQEAARVLGHALNEARLGQAALAGLSAGPETAAPPAVRAVGATPRTGPGREGGAGGTVRR